MLNAIIRLLSKNQLIKQSSDVVKIRKFLQQRQQNELRLIDKQTNEKQQLLHLSLEQMQKLSNKEELFATFTRQSLKKQIRSLNGLADVGMTRILVNNLKNKIPFTVKDHLKVQGCIQTCGFSNNISISNESCQIVKILEENYQCIAYAQSNVPQGLLGIQSVNKVYGSSRNPYNRKFISGGSSGGEGTTVSAKQAAFGIGSDSAGSVRIPAAFCGIYGFKPSNSRRVSIKGRLGATGKQGPALLDIQPSLGVLTRSARDVRWLCHKIIGQSAKNNFNPYLCKWDQQFYTKSRGKKFKIGYIMQNKEIDTAASIKNAMNQTIQILRSQKYQLIQFQFPQLQKFRDIFFQYFMMTGFYETMLNGLGNQRSSYQPHYFYDYAAFGKLGAKFMQNQASTNLQKQMHRRAFHQKKIGQIFGLIKIKDYYSSLFFKEWANKKIDILISPVMPFTAPLANNTSRIVNLLTFCSFQNILHMPAAAIPIRTVQSHQTHYSDTRFYGSQIKPAIQQSQGLPVSLQLTGLPMKDEQIIAILQDLQQILNKNNLGMGKAIGNPKNQRSK